ncbi:unnamed protein product [Symbiodinium natans]|uniref:Uncharacterized protein n=1 Tax=Symbiodinium natans TaxID=878477 RepID=A0A812R062_9DINO|nr:unnamed protein product [Symbiodinium natans]
MTTRRGMLDHLPNLFVCRNVEGKDISFMSRVLLSRSVTICDATYSSLPLEMRMALSGQGFDELNEFLMFLRCRSVATLLNSSVWRLNPCFTTQACRDLGKMPRT